MRPMIKQIYVPKDLAPGEIVIKVLRVERGARIRRGQVLLEFTVNQQPEAFFSQHDGWVRMLVGRPEQVMRPGELLMLIDMLEAIDYQPDGAEVSPQSELGGAGRRGLEREGQSQFAKGYSAPLFDAPERGEGMGNRLPQNPLMRNMKEGVPPKMQASAANNQPAIDKMSEDASHDPELRQQLSKELQQELNISPAPSIAPSNRIG
jgi:hypothetical protein